MPGSNGTNSSPPPAHQYYMINPKQPALEDNVLLRFEAPKVTLKWYHRGFFFFILGIISFFLSETVSGRRSLSQGYDNIYLMYPVYFFHLVVLSWLVLKVTDGRPTLPILFVAGSIFGMFEAYITKEVWVPNWNTEFVYYFGGVSIPHTLVLVCFWHNFSSFIVPLYIAELCFTNSTVNPISDALPKRVKFISKFSPVIFPCTFFTTTTILLIILAICSGDLMSEYSNLQEIGSAAIVIISLGFGGDDVITRLTAFWRWAILRSHNISIMDLLPRDVGFVFAFAGLLLFYMLDSFAYHLIRIPDFYPGQTTVWLMYLFLFLLLAGSVVHSRLRQVDYEEIDESTNEGGTLDMSSHLPVNYTAATPTHYWRVVVVFALVFELSAVGFYFWQPYPFVLVVVAYITGVSAGFCLLIGALIEATQGLILLRKRKML